ncbi:MAG: hypothetical protein ACXVX9_02455 [Mycobacteriaceae bacterium]
MRIGTWNLDGNWSLQHRALLEREECDVWLLTEVHVKTSIRGLKIHPTDGLMGPGKWWAAVCTTADHATKPDPHRASALVHANGFRFMSSVLPWRSSGPSWAGATLADKLRWALDELRGHIDELTIWGGDWNQALEGREFVGSSDGRDQILDLIHNAGLSVPTRSLGSASLGHRSIDHIAVPVGWDVDGAYRISAVVNGHRLSDHDAYVISVDH